MESDEIPLVEKMIFSMLWIRFEASVLIIVSLIVPFASASPERLRRRVESDRIFVFVEIFMLVAK